MQEFTCKLLAVDAVTPYHILSKMKSLGRAAVPQLVLVACVSVCGRAAGQNAAASEALFQRGVADMQLDKYESACPSLQESYELDPHAGTMFTLAECEAKWGKVATAGAHYADYLGMVARMPQDQRTRHADRCTRARTRIEILKPQVPHLTLELPSNAPNGFSVMRDGVTLSNVSLGIEVPVDPGEHVVVTQVPGGPRNEKRIRLQRGDRERLMLAFTLPDLTPPVAAAESPASAKAPALVPGSRPTSTAHTWSYIAGGVGVAGVLVGTVTGVMSMQKKRIVDDNCVSTACNTDGKAAADAGRTLGNISTLGFCVGSAGVAASLVLWFAAPNVVDRSARRGPPTSGTNQTSYALVGISGAW
jgi:hypothetical protein